MKSLGSRIGQRRVHRDRAQTIWVDAGFPWIFSHACGRVGHHASWARAMQHAVLHDCSPGSRW